MYRVLQSSSHAQEWKYYKIGAFKVFLMRDAYISTPTLKYCLLLVQLEIYCLAIIEGRAILREARFRLSGLETCSFL